VGLRDGLAFADGQRVVAVRAIAKRFLHEQVARDPPHRVDHALVADATADELLLDHPLALPLEGRAGGQGYRRPSPFRRSWALSLRPAPGPPPGAPPARPRRSHPPGPATPRSTARRAGCPPSRPTPCPSTSRRRRGWSRG